MTNCRNCGRKSDMFLCSGCVEELDIILDGMPWLLKQIEVSILRQDRLTVGEVGKSAGTPSPLNTDAVVIADRARNTISTWVRDLCETRRIEFTVPMVVSRGFIGPLKPDWRRVADDYQPTAADGARWLAEHVNAIALDVGAARCFKELHDLADEIVAAINRPDRHFAGPCPTVRAYSPTGKAIECGEFLYAGTEERNVTCPKCNQPVDVQRNRQRAWREGDLMTERVLLKRLTDIEEPVSRVQFYAWIKARKVAVRGWLHCGAFVEHYIQRGDPRVFSFREVRQLREAELKAAQAGAPDEIAAAEVPSVAVDEPEHEPPRRHFSRTYGQSGTST
ncbi:Uncharacterised protein [Mycobacteroides abscessus subsp. abscessus]|uniref:hypothetical protein n=1 Tax=Mycobacteroides abscessus TaxID=36809 RepID=UPI00092727AF|nr:hypothetical protein [Mycobacteroides abscessus]SIM00635.1 Uncharacterised protein [Mycobacteroides abscessus subsp. abscessus]